MGNLYQRLDDDQRELHDSWENIARMLVVVVVLAVIVWGLCSGLRWLVHASFDGVHHWLDGRGGDAVAVGALTALLVVGGLIRGAILRRPAWRETEGDGIDVALGNYHCTYEHAGDDPQPRYDRPAFGLAVRKLIATALTLGAGGSGGIEAPVVVAGEAIGAGCARVFQARREAELRTYQLAGIAAGVGTLLGAPFTAALFAIEVAYGDRIIYRKFAYALVAAMIGYALNQRVLGTGVLFSAPWHDRTYSLAEYGITVLVAVAVSAPIALGFGLLTRHTGALVRRADGMLRGAAGGAGGALVTIPLWLAADIEPHHVLGMGEHTLAELLTGVDYAWWFLALLLIGKMLTTGFTIGSGGSAGMLIPAMFLGGVSGRLTAELLELAGLAPAGMDPAIFVVVGIASSLVAVIGVPLAAIALVLEVFGPRYGPPAALACGMTYVLTLRIKVYGAQRRAPDPDADETGGVAPTA
ncbi:MAG: chloride channel protein [Myxococcales bacterium]|nr:chloride channel protein [Myxococcales bacterium]